jgi:RNA polymerase sigma-70 factor, ECF subfamily
LGFDEWLAGWNGICGAGGEEHFMDQKSEFASIVAELPRMHRYALSLTHDPDRSKDLVQESATRAMDNISKWTPGTNLRAWLMTILHNVFINESVRRRPLLTETGYFDSDVASPADQEARDELRDVARAFAGLNPSQRQIIWMACIQELDIQEIAKQLQIPAGTVRSRLCRAREQLRRDLKMLD